MLYLLLLLFLLGGMLPVYVCPKCGRAVSRAEGKYYCKSCGQDVLMRKVTSKSEWRRIGDSIVKEIYDEVHYWCWNVSGEPASECFWSHANEDLYTLASSYIREDTEEVLAVLSEMPDDVYNECNEKLRRMLEKEAREIERKYGKA